MAKKAARQTTGEKRGIRYTDEQKKEILDLIERTGHGGIARAVEQYGISAQTINNWRRDHGARFWTGSRPGNSKQVIRQLADLNKKMAAAEKKLATLRQEFDRVKSML